MDTDKLISLVHLRRTLWDQGDSRHHNRYVLDKLWGEVAQELNCTSDTARARWKSLRDGFRKELKKVPKGRRGDADLESDYSTWPHFRRVYFLRDQFASHAITGDIPPKENKSSRDEQIDTRDGGLENSQFSELDGASVDILDVKIENFEPLISNEHQVTPNVESGTTKLSTKSSYQPDVGSASSRIERSALKVSEDECKTWDEDASFFESLIPHIKGLSPARKMLLRMKIQELIYNFVYNPEF
ncbi:hypothetical protein B7P43_G02772 [Cryptotermes secundus]|uniref:MADF domain-containing protein n=1 Tax=Cryptotermes secundus TaxID=105785 RepID=A0A2J7QFF2_9NEOP|nr:uncharacterized protein LOC111867903 [Cryptotermes secundus]PNF27309.1 hypothetical protein B7P43_G02772 [Cryptotermes secundus]